MSINRRDFLKKGLAGTLLLGASALPQPLAAVTNEIAGVDAKRPKKRRVVLISLDGISVPGFQKANAPRLKGLLAEGCLSLNTRVVMPSVTLPNWTSHLTGSGPEQHGVVDNNWTPSNFKLPAIAVDEKGYYPSVFKVLKDAVPQMKTAFYYNWKELIYPYNQNYFDEASFLEKDGYVENYDKAFRFIKDNRDNPTLVFLYSVHTDHAGHRSQWMSADYIRSIEQADVEIGKFIDRMKADGLYEDTHFFFLSDHGGIGYGHGGVSVDEMIVPWGITGPKIRKGFKIEEANNTVNTAATILHLFRVEKPLPWVGEVPHSIFK